ncbi:CPBP family intramembrane metalloprotease [Maritimibacter sp. DP07]|uniref:CPBP family intramembrane metalloprotease n=1 Tax=Maritimibacter harenae TaxID=2606218 RepID=A0A845LZ88_9RHOB|nr:CPBP family intramembrane glutamic endopeptidase [Maritimibacter harenae]MZR12152.1 CPBP family intramembrane metalloprotease [Maritimibacter harenae]
MTLLRTLAFFGIPGFIIFVGLYVGVPIANDLGLPLIVSWTAALWLPIVLLLGWAVARWRRTHPDESFRSRFRLGKLRGKDWGIILAALVVLQVFEVLLSGTGAFFAQFAFFAPPVIIPELFDPTLSLEAGLTTFFGAPVEGNWWLILFWLGWLVVNIGGEELLWRGYALPLQERVFGKYAWLVNGLCWNLLIHAFMRWNFVTLMPISLTIPFLVQRYRNTWIGIGIHGLGNLMVLVLLVPSIAGWI